MRTCESTAQRAGRNPLFRKRWFSDDMILLCVRWYLRFKLSYRDLASIVAQLGVAVAPRRFSAGPVRYTGEFVRCWAPFEIFVGRSWRADETYIEVNGGWMYLYRAVNERGRTVASPLSRTRDQTAARIFFRQALKRRGEPLSITLDAFEPSHCALRRMGMRNEFNFRGANPVKIRSCKYLNNIVEQDYRRVKSRVSAMLGLKSFQNSRIVLAGIELIQKLKNGQYGVPFSFGICSRHIWKNVLAA